MAQTEGTGLFQFLKWGTESLDGATGVLTGGAVNVNPNPRLRLGIGGYAHRRGGLIVPGGNAEFYLSNTNTALVEAAFRASYPRGALTELLFEGGADNWSIGYETAVIQTLSIDYTQDEGMKANVEWGALLCTEEAGDTQDAETESNFEDYEFIISAGGDEYGVTDFGLSVNNNVTWRTAADTKAAGTLRFPTHYVYGVESVELSLTTNRPLPESLLGLMEDAQPDDIAVTLVGNNGVDEVSLALADLMGGESSHGFVDSNTAMQWSYNFIGGPQGAVTYTFTPGAYS